MNSSGTGNGTKTVGYHWHLRKVMDEHGMRSTTDLVPLLADRGVVMTSTQVYRIVVGRPERLNMQLLCALCDIFSITPNDLIEAYVATSSRRGRKTGTTRTTGTTGTADTTGTTGTAAPPPSGSGSGSRNRPTRAVITPARD